MTNKSKKILAEISAGELLDKMTILEIKLTKIKDKENLLEISKEYSKIMWQGLKSTGSSHHGLISLKESTINIDDGTITGGHIIIDMSSITCLDIKDTNSNKGLIGHLKSDDFFSVSDFSEASLHLVEINKLLMSCFFVPES